MGSVQSFFLYWCGDGTSGFRGQALMRPSLCFHRPLGMGTTAALSGTRQGILSGCNVYTVPLLPRYTGDPTISDCAGGTFLDPVESTCGNWAMAAGASGPHKARQSMRFISWVLIIGCTGPAYYTSYCFIFFQALISPLVLAS